MSHFKGSLHLLQTVPWVYSGPCMIPFSANRAADAGALICSVSQICLWENEISVNLENLDKTAFNSILRWQQL